MRPVPPRRPRRAAAAPFSVFAVAAVLAAVALCGTAPPLAAQDAVPPVDQAAPATPAQDATEPPADAPAARPEAPATAPEEMPAPRPDEGSAEDAAPPAAAATAPSEAAPSETPSAETPSAVVPPGAGAEPSSETAPTGETPPPAEGPTARPETADDPPALPASLAGVPDPVVALHISTTFCEDPSGPALADHAALLAELGPTAVLVGIPCTGDATRAAFRLYVLETGEIGGVHAQFFALPSKTLGWIGTEVLWAPSMDADGRLTGTLYDPGEGRCASRGRWRWNGYALAMETAELEATCGKGDWRTAYP